MANKINLPMEYDFVIIHCNYTSRIPAAITKNKTPRPDDVKEYFEEAFYDSDNLVFIKDELWGKDSGEEFHLYGDKIDADFVTDRYGYDGIIVFKNLDFGKVMKAITCLGELRFCGSCDHENIYNITVDDIEGKKVLHIQIDTESG